MKNLFFIFLLFFSFSCTAQYDWASGLMHGIAPGPPTIVPTPFSGGQVWKSRFSHNLYCLDETDGTWDVCNPSLGLNPMDYVSNVVKGADGSATIDWTGVGNAFDGSLDLDRLISFTNLFDYTAPDNANQVWTWDGFSFDWTDKSPACNRNSETIPAVTGTATYTLSTTVPAGARDISAEVNGKVYRPSGLGITSSGTTLTFDVNNRQTGEQIYFSYEVCQ